MANQLTDSEAVQHLFRLATESREYLHGYDDAITDVVSWLAASKSPLVGELIKWREQNNVKRG